MVRSRFNGSRARVGVLVDPGASSEGLDVPRLSRLLEAEPQLAATSAPERDVLDRTIRFIQANELDRLVVASLDLSATHRACGLILEGAGRDSFGYRLVDVVRLSARVHPGAEATAKAFLLILAGAARLSHQQSPGRANLRLRAGLDDKGRPGPGLACPLGMRYSVVPSAGSRRCDANEGCKACVMACPIAAIEIDSGRARVQKTRCVGCGLCVLACPTGAIRHPLYAPQALDEELSMLLERGHVGPSSRVVAVACRRGMANLMEVGHACVTYPSSVLPMEVPCLLSVHRRLVLRAFELGADGVVLLGCAGNCLLDLDLTGLEETVQTLREELQARGISRERLSLINDAHPSRLGGALQEYAARVASLAAVSLRRRQRDL